MRLFLKPLTLFFLLLLFTAFVVPGRKKVKIYLAGDSTMQSYREHETPMRGWGQYFAMFFKEGVVVENKAIGGRSTKTFISEGRWQQITDQLEKGDWVLIQFGHNDQSNKPERYTSPEAYRENLQRMVQEVQEKRANPVLLTSICMRRFSEQGAVVNGLGVYPEICREVAKTMQVPLIDLNELTSRYISLLGEEPSKEIYMWFKPGEHAKYPDGLQDNTHLKEAGARKVAALAAQQIRDQQIKPLSRYLKK